MAECVTMVNFDHPNVVRLIGVCFDATDQLPFIILPFMANKDLKSFLVAKREQSQNLKEDQFPKVCRLEFRGCWTQWWGGSVQL